MPLENLRLMKSITWPIDLQDQEFPSQLFNDSRLFTHGTLFSKRFFKDLISMIIKNLVFIQFRRSIFYKELCSLNSITIDDLCILMCAFMYPLIP